MNMGISDEELDQIINQFGDSWKSEDEPGVEYVLVAHEEAWRGDPASRKRTLKGLLAVELQKRYPGNTTWDCAGYYSRFPQDSDVLDELFHSASNTTNPHDTEERESATQPFPDRKRIGPYQLFEKLGEGGMGTVWLAKCAVSGHHVPAEKLVALKQFHERFDDRRRLQLVRQEIAGLANLDHPNIIPLLDSSFPGPNDPAEVPTYVVFEFICRYVDGQPKPALTLADAKAGMGLDRVRSLVKTLAEALAHAHGRGVYHLDVKPQNVLLDERDSIAGEGIPMLADFGLAHVAYQPNAVAGFTPLYTAPERITGGGQLDSKYVPNGASDVWSLGVVMYELLAGGLPFNSIPAIKHGEFPRLQNVPEDVSRLVEQCLKQNPIERPSANQLAKALTPRAKLSPNARKLTAALAGIAVLALVSVGIGWYVIREQGALGGKIANLPGETASAALEHVRELFNDPDVLTGKIKSFIRQRAVEEIAKAREQKANWQEVDEIHKRRDQALENVEDLIANIRDGLTGDPDPIFTEAARILAENGPAEAIEYLESKRPDTLKEVDKIIETQSQAEEKKRELLGRILMEADLHKTNLARDDALRLYETVVDKAPQWSRARAEYGNLLRELARYSDARPHLESAYQLASENDEISFAANNLGTLELDEANWDAAEPLMRRALAIDEQFYGAEHPNVAAGLNNLALLLKATNRLAEAEPLYRRALAIDEQSYGAAHTRVAIHLNNLAGLLQATNRLAEAEPLMRRALAIDEQSYGAEHPNVAIRLNNLAALLWSTNRLAEAEPLMRRALAIDEQSYGAEHPDVAAKLNNLAGLLQASNRLAEAEPLMRRALAIVEQSYGSEHPRVAIDLNNLARLLQATNRLAEAEPLMRRALAINEQSFGAEHPNVAVNLNNLAQLLKDTNRLAEAEPLMRRALAIDEQSYGPAHSDVAIDLNNLAGLLQATNRLAEAEPLMRRALAIDEQSYGSEHPNVARDLNNLALLLQDTNRLAEAEPLMRRALAIDEQSYGAEHPDVAIDLNNLARLLQDTNRLAEAEPLMRRALAINEQSFGAEHPNVAVNLNNLAQLLKDTNRLAEAEPLMRRALAINERSYGAEHSEVAIALNNLASLLKVTNRLAEAEPLMRRVVEIIARFGNTTGHQHPHMEGAIANYRKVLVKMELSEEEIDRRIKTVTETESPLEPIAPEVERLLGPAKSVQEMLAKLDQQYKAEGKPEIYFLPPGQPIASHIEKLLGPAKSVQEVFDDLDRQYREQGKPDVWFLPLSEPIVPHLDEILGPVKEEK